MKKTVLSSSSLLVSSFTFSFYKTFLEKEAKTTIKKIYYSKKNRYL